MSLALIVKEYILLPLVKSVKIVDKTNKEVPLPKKLKNYTIFLPYHCTIGGKSLVTNRFRPTQVSLLELNTYQTNVTSKVCNTRLPINPLDGAMVDIGQGRVLLAGGGSTSTERASLFEGKLYCNGLRRIHNMDIKWKKLSIMPTTRYGHVAFKLNQDVFITEGFNDDINACLTTDVYKLEENSWEKVDNMPFGLGDRNKYRSLTSATDIEEKCALILEAKNLNLQTSIINFLLMIL